MRLPEPAGPAPIARARVEGHERLVLDEGWEVAASPPDAHTDTRALEQLAWLPARVPGTAAGALRDAGEWRPGEERDFDAEDWWFRTRFHAAPAAQGEELALELDGIATVADVFLNGEPLLSSETMFASYSLNVVPAEENELAIRCRALAPLLAQRRKPRARWRTRLVEGNLRFFRTMLLGRAPGFAPGPAAVGPWRPVRLVRRREIAVEQLKLRTALDGEGNDAAGMVSVRARLRRLDNRSIETAELELSGPSGIHTATLELLADRGGAGAIAQGNLSVPRVARWWPHTHGEPALHDVRLHLRTTEGPVTVDAGRVGFRTLAARARPGHDIEADGLDLHVNGVRVFARGAVWTPVDLAGLAPEPQRLRATLEAVRDAGMNMLRVPGTSAYESPAFHDLCDELGLLVWQDFMFANLDYPISDEGFRASVEREARAQLDELGGRPSLAVLCGNSEIEQQVAMLGLDPTLGRSELFGELLPGLVAEAGTDALYVPSSPCGGELPFRPEHGIANYYGVGGYRRPLEDARRAEVRFAGECLAFSNVPNEAGVDALLPEGPAHMIVGHPKWKAGVPRDVDSEWDFEDVRDHYLELIFGVDPSELRRCDHERYLELSRAVTGEVMAEVFGEWRRAGSPCGGGLVLWLSDLVPGAGWGVIDHLGMPKPAYYHLQRALAPVAVWMIDEGLGGIHTHVANDRPTPLIANLRVTLYRDGQQPVERVSETLELAAHDTCTRDIEAMLGRFVDVSWAYRFGAPGHDVVAATLERERESDAPEVLSQAFRFPAGRPLCRHSAEELGLEGTVRRLDDRTLVLRLHSHRIAYGVRVHLPGLLPRDDALTLEPGVAREILLEPAADRLPDLAASGALTALNLDGRVRVRVEEQDE